MVAEPTSPQVPQGDASGDRSEQDLAKHLLDEIRTDRDLSGLALYLPIAGSLRRVVTTGTGRFPALWSAAQESQSVLQLGDALLVATEGDLELGDAQRLSVRLAVRALTLSHSLRDRDFAAHYHGVEMQALYDVGLAIASTLDTRELGVQILMHALALLDARRGALFLRRDGELHLEESLGGEARQTVAPEDPQLLALLDGEDPEEQDLLPGAQHLCGVGIGDGAMPRGLLLVADKESRSGIGPFGSGDRQTLALLANQAAIALETAELHQESLTKRALERELELAAEIQRRLLPAEVPQPSGWEIHGWSRPARRVGGDWYDLLELPDDQIGVILGDVSGKGMPAALMVSTLHAGLRLLSGRERFTEVVRRCNRYLHTASTSNRFATLFLGDLDPERGEFSYLNAGHDPGLVIRRDGSVELLRAAGLPLGVMGEGSWREETIGLEGGDLLCLYSDGMTEAASPQEEEFGRERLAEALRSHGKLSLAELAEALEEEVSAFAAGAPQADDQTVLLLRRSA